jgi:hypothetical protein
VQELGASGRLPVRRREAVSRMVVLGAAAAGATPTRQERGSCGRQRAHPQHPWPRPRGAFEPRRRKALSGQLRRGLGLQCHGRQARPLERP